MSAILKLFVDTDVIIDSIGSRKPYEKTADKLLTLGVLKELELWIGPVQWLRLYEWLVRGPDRAMSPGKSYKPCLSS